MDTQDDDFLSSLGIENIVLSHTPISDASGDAHALILEHDAEAMLFALDRFTSNHEERGARYTNAAFYALLLPIYQRAKQEKKERLATIIELGALSFTERLKVDPAGLVAPYSAKKMVSDYTRHELS